MTLKTKKILITGAGFFGAVLAERIAEDAGLPVTVIDRRPHIGGNSWSETDPESGVEFHKYGSHIFHTSDPEVWSYIRRFTEFNQYRHTVWTTSRGKVYSLPINLASINGFYGLALSPAEARELIRREASELTGDPANLEEKAIAQIGRPLYQALIYGYTRKQWEKDPRELSPAVINRLPVRYSYNNRYFSDPYEGIPLEGYGQVFKNLLAHERIRLRLNAEYREILPAERPDLTIYSGAIDEFFAYRLGRLEWRTVDLEPERPDTADFQGCTVMNYADAEVPFTRIHEFKHFMPERPDSGKTLIFREYSRFARAGDEPYYPVDTAPNRELYQRYRELAAREAPQVIFGGRLGGYRYLDMDKTIAAALACYRTEVKPRLGA